MILWNNFRILGSEIILHCKLSNVKSSTLPHSNYIYFLNNHINIFSKRVFLKLHKGLLGSILLTSNDLGDIFSSAWFFGALEIFELNISYEKIVHWGLERERPTLCVLTNALSWLQTKDRYQLSLGWNFRQNVGYLWVNH